MRFGNKAFRCYIDKMREQLNGKLKEAFDVPHIERAIPEISTYFIESFGSYERLDFGTGHELNFLAFLFCLVKLNLVQHASFKALVNVIFEKYLHIIRKV